MDPKRNIAMPTFPMPFEAVVAMAVEAAEASEAALAQVGAVQLLLTMILRTRSLRMGLLQAASHQSSSLQKH